MLRMDKDKQQSPPRAREEARQVIDDEASLLRMSLSGETVLCFCVPSRPWYWPISKKYRRRAQELRERRRKREGQRERLEEKIKAAHAERLEEYKAMTMTRAEADPMAPASSFSA